MAPTKVIIEYGLICGVLLINFLSCKTNIQNSVSSETEVINDVFMELVGNGYYYKNTPIPPMPLTYAKTKQDTLDFHQQNKKIEEAFKNPVEEEKKLVIEVESNLFNPSNKLKGFYNNKTSIESLIETNNNSYSELILKLISSETYNKNKLHLSALSKTGKYIIEAIDENEHLKKKAEFKKVAQLRFSNMVFNSQNNLVVFYFEEDCGRHCGGGEIIFCKKEKEIWVIDSRYPLWVS